MLPSDRVLDLIVTYEELVGAGRPITPELLCADCPDLLVEVRRHLSDLQCFDRLFDAPAPPSDAGVAALDLPDYPITRELGRGGMGVVYEARDTKLDRIVALKTVLGAHPAIRARFVAEGRAVAAIDHPNVIQVYESGERDGVSYLVMEYLPRGTLRERLDQLVDKRLDPLTAALAVMKIANGVAAVHSLGTVHRDLKPSNVLFDAKDEPKVADFGLAKRNVGGHLTLPGATLGTPAYMAPEQASSSTDADPRIDVWALGVILYECLTGHAPFGREPLHTVLKRAAEKSPERPRALVKNIPRGLETICLKCLEKQPSDRYQTAAELAADLDRWRSGLPITARAPGLGKRFRLWVYRNPVVASLLAVVALVASAGGGIAFNEWWKRKDEEAARERESGLRERAERAERQVTNLNTQLVGDRGVIAIERSDPTAAVFHLTRALELATDRLDQQRYLRTALASAYDSLHRLENVIPNGAEIRAAAGSHDGQRIVFVDAAGALRVHNLVTKATTDPMPIKPAVLPKRSTDLSLGAVSFLPDGRIVTAAQGGQIYVIDAGVREYHHRWTFPGNPRALSVSRDIVLVGGIGAGGAASLAGYNLSDGKVLKLPFDVPGQVDAIAFSPDGRFFATSGRWDNRLRVWQVQDGKLAFEPIPHPGRVYAVTFSRDGSKVVTGCADCGIRFWNTETGIVDGTTLRHSHPVRALAYHRDGDVDLLLSGAEDGAARVWDVGLRAPTGQPLNHIGNVRAVAFCVTGRVTRLITTGFDRAVRVWRLRPEASVTTFRHPAGVAAIAYAPDGPSVLTGCRDSMTERGGVRLWRNEDKHWVFRGKFEQNGEALAIGMSGRIVLGAGNDGYARLWARDGTPDRDALPNGPQLNVVYTAAITTDGRYVAFAGQGRRIHLLDRTTGRLRVWDGPDTGWVWTVAFTPDGTHLLTDGRSGIRLWDVQKGWGLWNVVNGRSKAEMQLKEDDEVRWSTFSPDGNRILACGFNKGQAGVWEVKGGLLNTFSGHKGQVYMGAFDPINQDTVATVGADHTARVWDVKTGQEKYRIAHDGKVLCVAFAPDGHSLITGCEDGTVRVWSSGNGDWMGPILYHQGAVTRVACLPSTKGPQKTPAASDDGTTLPEQQILTASNDGTVRLWTIPAPMNETPDRLRRKFMRETGMAPVARTQAEGTDPIRSGEGLLRILTPEDWQELQKDE